MICRAATGGIVSTAPKYFQRAGGERFDDGVRRGIDGIFQLVVRGAEQRPAKPAVAIRPNVDEADARIQRGRPAGGVGNQIGRRRGELRRFPAVRFAETQNAADDDAVLVFVQRGAQFAVAVRIPGENEVNCNRFRAGFRKPRDERGPDVARPRKLSAQRGEHRIIGCLVGQNRVGVAWPVNTDEDEIGVGRREAAVARKVILNKILRGVQRRGQPRRGEKIQRQHGERDEGAKAGEDDLASRRAAVIKRFRHWRPAG